MIEQIQATAATIDKLNDRFRKGDRSLGKVMATASVGALPIEKRRQLMNSVISFDDFQEGNDPYGEHDFGSIELDGEKYFWKIDYYDSNYEYGSEDPANTDLTRRVLTIMHSSEY